GNEGSTSNFGASTRSFCASTVRSSARSTRPSATRAATNATWMRRGCCLIARGPPLLLHELLNALPLEGLTGVQVTLRVHADAADEAERARPAAAIAEIRHRLERRAIEREHFLVLAVGDEQVALRGVVRKRDVPHRSVHRRRLRDDAFLDERAVFLEDLEAIVLAIADVDLTVFRERNAAHVTEVAAVSCPLTLERARVR